MAAMMARGMRNILAWAMRAALPASMAWVLKAAQAALTASRVPARSPMTSRRGPITATTPGDEHDDLLGPGRQVPEPGHRRAQPT